MTDRIQYRKRASFHVTAVKLDLDFEGFNFRKWGGEQTCQQGDWLVNNGGDTYTVSGAHFNDNYQEISPGQFSKIGSVWASEATDDGEIPTSEGKTTYKIGDYLVFDRPQGGDAYAIKRQKFEQMYEPVIPDNTLGARELDYLERLNTYIDWYDEKANKNKWVFHIFQTIAVVSAASVPVFSVKAEQFAFLIAILGGASAAISGILSLFQFQSNWIKFRSTNEDLKSHLAQYKAKAGLYENGSEAFELLVDSCEKIISAERGQWAQNHARNAKSKESE